MWWRAKHIIVPTLVAANLASVGAQPPAPEKIVGGPYVVNASERSATVAWVVQSGEVAFGTEPGKANKSIPVLRVKKTMLNGLHPGTTYYYQAFPGDAGRGSFKTPPSGAAKFQFVVYGDTRTRHDVHRSVVQAMLKYSQPDFILHTGDLVENGNDSSLWPIFFDIER